MLPPSPPAMHPAACGSPHRGQVQPAAGARHQELAAAGAGTPDLGSRRHQRGCRACAPAPAHWTCDWRGIVCYDRRRSRGGEPWARQRTGGSRAVGRSRRRAARCWQAQWRSWGPGSQQRTLRRCACSRQLRSAAAAGAKGSACQPAQRAASLLARRPPLLPLPRPVCRAQPCRSS